MQTYTKIASYGIEHKFSLCIETFFEVGLPIDFLKLISDELEI